MRWNTRLGVLAGSTVAAVLLAAPSAFADTTLPLHGSHTNTTAEAFSSHGCDFGPTQKPAYAHDVWVFVLPGNKGDFTGLTLTFSDAGTTVTVRIPASGEYQSAIVTDKGASKAWVALPAGWTLTGGAATISGSASTDFFNLTHTCPAASTGGNGDGSGGGSGGGSGEETPGGGQTPGTGTSTSSPATAAPSLPVTGSSVLAMVSLGIGLLAAGGVVLAVLRRRRQPTFTA